MSSRLSHLRTLSKLAILIAAATGMAACGNGGLTTTQQEADPSPLAIVPMADPSSSSTKTIKQSQDLRNRLRELSQEEGGGYYLDQELA